MQRLLCITCVITLLFLSVLATNTLNDEKETALDEREALTNLHQSSDFEEYGEEYFDDDEYGGEYIDNDEYYLDAVNVSDPKSFQTRTLRKCHCQAQEIYNGTSCTSFEGTITLFEVEDGIPQLVDTSWFNVSIKPLLCQNGFEKVTLNGSLLLFYLLSDMSLYIDHNQIFVNPDQFCIDHIYGLKNKPSWSVDICTSPVALMNCCLENEYYDRIEKHCRTKHSPLKQIPLVIDFAGHQVQYSNVTRRETKSLKCSGSDEEHWLDLHSSEAQLFYHFDGVFMKDLTTKNSDVIEPEQFCVVSSSNGIENLKALSCKQNLTKEFKQHCSDKACVRKCCPEDFFFDDFMCSRLKVGMVGWMPKFHNFVSGSLLEYEKVHDYKILIGTPPCTSDHFILTPHANDRDQFYILKNGSLHVPNFPNMHIEPNNFCIENWVSEDFKVHEQAIVCFSEKEPAITFCVIFEDWIYPSLFITSIIFLIITVVVYISVPELRAKVHGKCLISHAMSLTAFYCGMVIMKCWNFILSKDACIVLGEFHPRGALAAHHLLTNKRSEFSSQSPA